MSFKLEEKLHPLQVEIYRKMSFAQKWEIALGMQRMAREIRANYYRKKNPDWTDAEVQREVAREITRSVT